MIYVDERVGSRDLEALLRFYGVPVKVRQLKYGDFAFFSPYGPNEQPVSVGIERKRILDLIACIDTKRFAGSQLPGMIQTFDFNVLMVEGRYHPDHESGRLNVLTRNNTWKDSVWQDQQRDYRLVDSYLNTLRWKTNVQVIKTISPEQTACEIYMLYHWFTNKKWDQHKSHIEFHVPPPPGKVEVHRPSFFRQVAKELPGIGWERSKEVEKVFRGDLVAAFTAGVSEWANINGITLKRAQEIWRKLRGLGVDGESIYQGKDW